MEPSGEDVGSIAWRQLFIVNELSELSTGQRTVPPETTLFWFIFFFLSLGWQWIAQYNPYWFEVEYPKQPFNEFFKFFLSSFLILCIVTVQVIINRIQAQTDDPDSVNFADLCILANCSVLIMTGRYHGYYIHGKAPWGKSDLPMSWLKMELDMEAENRRKPRAMGAEAEMDVAESSRYGNTYEIFMQPNFRDNFDAWRETPLEQMDNRNLSAKERASIDEQKRASIAMRSKKDEKVVRDAGEGDELNEQGMNQKEVKIIREERKKRIMNHMLCQTFHLIDEKRFNNISEKNRCERLLMTAPANFSLDSVDETKAPFHLVRDK